jgi:histidine kinase
MAAGIAHELNQPLTGIKNYAKNALYMIEQGTGNQEEVKGNLQLISTQVDRASKIIGQMRELARRTERHFAPVDINQKLRETVEFVIPQMRLSGVETKLALSEDLPEVMGDGLRLEQVFLNLLMNARQAMEKAHQRHLTITTRHDPNSEWPVVIEIADTGKGFAPESAQRLFAPFFTTKEAGHGTGLGLSISLSIIKDHQGTIEAKGEVGRGATFTVRLPARDPRQGPTGEASPARLQEVSTQA